MRGNAQWNALGVGVAVLPNGDCEHLQADGKCGIYESRPAGCRSFDCSKDADFQRRHPKVAQLLITKGL